MVSSEANGDDKKQELVNGTLMRIGSKFAIIRDETLQLLEALFHHPPR